MNLQISSCCRLLIGLAFFVSAAVCLPASAGDQPVNQCPPASEGDHAVKQWPGTTVKFSDLDLNTDAGRRELLDRLSKAANRVCRDDGPISGLAGYGYHRCYRRTLAAAVDKLHQEQVSALFAAMQRPNTR
jgi:UrcA family protein